MESAKISDSTDFRPLDEWLDNILSNHSSTFFLHLSAFLLIFAIENATAVFSASGKTTLNIKTLITMNKKIFLILLAALYIGTQFAAARILYVPLYIIDPNQDVRGTTKTPNLQLFLTQDDHQLTFPGFPDRMEVLLKNKAGRVCSLDTINAGVSTIAVPSSFVGDYEIRFVAQGDNLSYYYYGYITLERPGSSDILADSIGYSGTTTSHKSSDVPSVSGNWENIVPLDHVISYEELLNNVMQLNAVEYNKKNENERKVGILTEDYVKYLPQTTKEVENQIGIEFMPTIAILYSCIQELKYQLDDRTNLLVEVIMARGSDASVDRVRAALGSRLCSITPIPAKEQAIIKYLLADDVQEATISICDMSGKMVQKVPVKPSDTSVTISCSGMSAGIYLCSLVLNGKEVNTLRMIISK
jgi:hypothetical protein